MIAIELFGKFRIEVDGQDATQALGNSQKGRRLLEYLILHRDDPMTASELYTLLWPDEGISNPENALKTLLCRTRSALSRFDPLLSECIITAHGAYRWNTELPQTVDVFTFEALCTELLQAKEHTDEMEEKAETAFALYKGDLSAMGDTGDWIIARNTYYSSLCIKTARHAIQLMEANQHDAGIIRVAQRGLMVDPLDEEMHLALMRSLVKQNRRNKALRHYHRTQNVYFNEYGTHLPESVQNVYKDLIHADQSADLDIDTVKLTLQQADAAAHGVCSCEYAIFKDVTLPLTRALAYLGQNCCLVVMMITPVSRSEEGNALCTRGAMENLLAVMEEVLRPFDVVSRCSPAQVIMLLPSVTMQSGQALLDRIRRGFEKLSTDSTLKLTSRIVPIVGLESLGGIAL